MNIKDCTQTVSGAPVKIYEVYENQIHGAIGNTHDKNWRMQVWTTEGKYSKMDKSHPFDLDLTDWRDEIPWDHLIDDIEYVAMDRNGNWWGHKYKPESMPLGDTWEADGSLDDEWDLSGIKMPIPPNWKESLVKRPR